MLADASFRVKRSLPKSRNGEDRPRVPTAQAGLSLSGRPAAMNWTSSAAAATAWFIRPAASRNRRPSTVSRDDAEPDLVRHQRKRARMRADRRKQPLGRVFDVEFGEQQIARPQRETIDQHRRAGAAFRRERFRHIDRRLDGPPSRPAIAAMQRDTIDHLVRRTAARSRYRRDRRRPREYAPRRNGSCRIARPPAPAMSLGSSAFHLPRLCRCRKPRLRQARRGGKAQSWRNGRPTADGWRPRGSGGRMRRRRGSISPPGSIRIAGRSSARGRSIGAVCPMTRRSLRSRRPRRLHSAYRRTRSARRREARSLCAC